jgi:hypothetical protein
MDTLRGRMLLILFCLYPIYGYIAVQFFEVDPNYLAGIIIYLAGAELLITKFRNNENLRIPPYLIWLGLFTLYLLFSKILISNLVIETGLLKYLYRDHFLRALVALLIIENTKFDKKAIDLSLKFLFWVIVIAAGVSVIQIDNPLFFRNAEWLKNFGSAEQYEKYLENLGTYQRSDLDPVKEGYRYSIYSWINDISIGIDAMAIFSILLGIKALPGFKRGILIISAGLISFLSSSRWIMLNFLAIFSQRIIGQKQPFLYAFRLGISLVMILVLLVMAASVLGIDMNQFIQNRLLDESAGTRIYAFEVFGKVFPEHPIFGTGGADTPRMLMLIQGKTSQIHVGWLKMLYYYGIVGGLIYITFIFSMLRHLYKLAIHSRYWGSFFALLAVVLANFTLVELSIFYHGILLAMIFARYLQNQPEISSYHKLQEALSTNYEKQLDLKV